VKKIRLLVVLLLAVLAVSGCPLLGSKGDVYITVETASATLITVKFLEPTDNAGSYNNQFSDNKGKVLNNGYSWYRYEVPAGTYDAYIEWVNGPAPWAGRARITIDPDSSGNQWAAVYPDTGGNAWAEQGGGEFAPLLIHLP
jgi:hypothetical protein